MGAQIFRPSANSLAQISILGVATVPLLGGLALAALSRSPANTKVLVPKNQPVPFSHQHHAWELGIDCRYCHTSVEKSANAGFPSTETCMSCHSQIWQNAPMLEPVRASLREDKPIQWNRVHQIPDFAYFNHGIHVQKGVGCTECHGRVDLMPLPWKEWTLSPSPAASASIPHRCGAVSAADWLFSACASTTPAMGMSGKKRLGSAKTRLPCRRG